jgi:predicted helicase
MLQWSAIVQVVGITVHYQNVNPLYLILPLKIQAADEALTNNNWIYRFQRAWKVLNPSR